MTVRGVAFIAALVVAVPAFAEPKVILAPNSPRRSSCAPASGWQQAAFDDNAWAIAAGAPCPVERFRYHFSLSDDEAKNTRALELIAQYQHGFVAYLNGTELARSNLPPGVLKDTTPAKQVKTPEPEHYYASASALHAGDNVLAFEVHATARGESVALAAALLGSDRARIVRGPQLVRSRDEHIAINFDTDLPVRATVRYGKRALPATSVNTLHHVVLPLLPPGTDVDYTVRLGDEEPIAFRLRVPPKSGAYKFVVYGDVRDGHDTHAAIVKSILAEHPDFVLTTGDLVDRGADVAEWQRVFAVMAPLLSSLVMYPAQGNHDWYPGGQGVSLFRKWFEGSPLADNRIALGESKPAAYYSFDVAGTHFVALDSMMYASSAQLNWLKSDLKAAAARKSPIFAFVHDGPASAGMHGGNSTCLKNYVPVLKQYGTRMIFAGHDHDYERGVISGLPYIVSGGGGAPMRPSRCGSGTNVTCPPNVQQFINEHHYVTVEVSGRKLKVCPKRPDGSALEACTEY